MAFSQMLIFASTQMIKIKHIVIFMYFERQLGIATQMYVIQFKVIVAKNRNSVSAQ